MICRRKISLFPILLFLLVTLTTNCGKKLEMFTNATKNNYSLTSNDISYIQFYIDPGIRLRFDELVSQASVTNENEVRNEVKKYEKTIDILPETPGVAIQVEENSIVVSFAEDLNLEFAPGDDYLSTTPYKLISFNGKEISNGNEVHFRNRIYTLNFGLVEDKYRSNEFEPTSATPVLKYKFKSDLDIDKDREVIKGRTVN